MKAMGPSVAPAMPQAGDLLRLIARGGHPDVVRAFRPPPTVAFGRLDRLRPGYEAGLAAARRHGFAPLLREPGGHAAAYHEGCLVVEELRADPEPIAHMQQRFRDRGTLLAGALRTLGVDARLGPVPREYCPGEFTVNARGRAKLVGTAQRVIRGAWLFASVIVVEDVAPVRAVLVDVYRELGMDFDPATVGAVAEEVPGVTVDAVERAVLDAYASVGAG
jgi:lipoate-protein ligase A